MLAWGSKALAGGDIEASATMGDTNDVRDRQWASIGARVSAASGYNPLPALPLERSSCSLYTDFLCNNDLRVSLRDPLFVRQFRDFPLSKRRAGLIPMLSSLAMWIEKELKLVPTFKIFGLGS